MSRVRRTIISLTVLATPAAGPVEADEIYRAKELMLRGGKVILQPTQEAPTPAPRADDQKKVPTQPSAPSSRSVTGPRMDMTSPRPTTSARVVNQPIPADRVIVSMERRVSEDDRKALAAKGIEIGDFLGDTNYVAKVVQTDTERAVRDSTGINKIVRIFPLDTTSSHIKIDPALSGLGTSNNRSMTPPSAADRIEITVQLFPDVNVEHLRTQLSAIGEVVRVSPFTRRVELKVSAQEAIERIARIPGVMTVAPTYAPKTQNTHVRASIGATVAAAAPYNLSGRGVKVGVWDGGHVAERHPSFQGRLTVDLQREGELRRDDEHATHVAGTIAGTGAYEAAPLIAGSSNQPLEREATPFGNKVKGPSTQANTLLPAAPAPAGSTASPMEKSYPGVAPAASLASYSFRNAVDELIGLLVEKPDAVDVVNNSWSVNLAMSGCGQRAAYDALGASFYDALINGEVGGQKVRRIPVLFAAGNFRDDGLCGMSTTAGFENYRSVVPPGTAKNVITVGAIDADNGAMTSFSGWGPTASGRLKPDVVAAGCRDLGGGDRGVISAVPRDGIGRMCGTSMATPAVTGGVALLMERVTAHGNDHKTILPSTWKALLIHGAEDLGRPGPDFEFGYGRIDLAATLKLIDDKAYNERIAVKEGDVVASVVTVPTGRRQVKVTLAWDDPASSALANDVLVNDLDLVLISPSGERILPLVANGVPGREREAALRGVDRLNVVEQVVITDPAPGEWRIETSATLLGTPRNGQSFSLVVSTR